MRVLLTLNFLVGFFWGGGVGNDSTSGCFSLGFCHSCLSLVKEIAWEKNKNGRKTSQCYSSHFLSDNTTELHEMWVFPGVLLQAMLCKSIKLYIHTTWESKTMCCKLEEKQNKTKQWRKEKPNSGSDSFCFANLTTPLSDWIALSEASEAVAADACSPSSLNVL